MPVLLRAGWVGVGGVALGVGGELEEHLLQPGAVGRPQLEDGYAGREGDVPDLVGVGLGQQAVGPDVATT